MNSHKFIKTANLALPLFLTAYCLGLLWLIYGVNRPDFSSLLCIYLLLFACYAWFFCDPNGLRFIEKQGILLGILLRFSLLFALPNLSDDFYRFLWDGRLWTLGIHPFSHTPEQLMQGEASTDAFLQRWYPLLNSQRFYTVYPPVCQLSFAWSACLFPGSLPCGVLALKLFLFACECGSIGILCALEKQVKMPQGWRPSLLYALNPLLIAELAPNVHYEAAMICFMLAGLYAIQLQKTGWSALFWALATASKLLPILFVPLICAWLGLRNSLRFLTYFAFFSALFFVPMLDVQALQNMMQSIDLYFRKFEFNASVYYLCRQVGFWQTGWNIGARIGPQLALITPVFVGLSAMWLFWKRHWIKQATDIRLLFRLLCLVESVHLLCSTTVHPWYVAVPFSFALFAGKHFVRLLALWTALVVFSYSHYSGGAYVEKLEWVALEYIILGLAAIGLLGNCFYTGGAHFRNSRIRS